MGGHVSLISYLMNAKMYCIYDLYFADYWN